MIREITDDQWLELRNAIILQAAADYSAIEKGVLKENGFVNKKEIVSFFVNDCNGLICDIEDVRGIDILRAIKYEKRKRIFNTTLRNTTL